MCSKKEPAPCEQPAGNSEPRNHRIPHPGARGKKPLDSPHMGAHALAYARHGLRVFPIYEPVSGACSCGNPDCASVGKHPRTAHGVDDASSDPMQIREWWTRWPNANIGLAAGSLIFVDVDPQNGGDKSLLELEGQHGKIETLRVQTGSGGLHLYLQPDGAPIKGRIAMLQGIDIKSTGGYVVAPPSLHASGKRYQFAGSNIVSAAPAWLVELINGKNGSGGKERFDTAAALQGVSEGKRNETIFKLASKFRSAGIPFPEALELVLKAAAKCSPAFPANEARGIVERVYQRYQPAPEKPLPLTDDEIDQLERAAIQAEGGGGYVRPSPGFQPAALVMQEPNPEEIVEGIAWADKISVVVSESGAGKTFVLLSLAASTSTGQQWYGRSVKHGSVAYVSYEGDALGLRLRALKEKQGHQNEHVYVLRALGSLSPAIDRDRIEVPSPGEHSVVAALAALRDSLAKDNRPPIGFVIVDTVRASLSGSEDSSEHVSAYLRVVRRMLRHIPGAAAILAHHAGWQDGDTKRRRERGSSAFRGNVDGTLYLEVAETLPELGEARLTLTSSKARDAWQFGPLHLLRRRVFLSDVDSRGNPVTSCVIEKDPRTNLEREADKEAATIAEDHVFDRKVLRVIHEHQDVATAQERIRLAVGANREDVYASLERLIQDRLLLPPQKQRQPYKLTELGLSFMQEEQICV